MIEPMPADIRAISTEELEKLATFYEKRKEWYKTTAKRSMPTVSYNNLDRVYNELDRRDGLLDDNYQLIITQEI